MSVSVSVYTVDRPADEMVAAEEQMEKHRDGRVLVSKQYCT